MSAPVTADVLAAALSVSRETVYRMARAGHIPAIRVGRAWRFNVDDVKARLSAEPDSWAQPERARRSA